MMDAVTVKKLHEMKLSSMAEFLKQQSEIAGIDEMSFEERFGLLVDAEWARRRSRQLNSLIKNANLSIPNAALENIEYDADRHLDKAQITRLATCSSLLLMMWLYVFRVIFLSPWPLLPPIGLSCECHFLSSGLFQVCHNQGHIVVAY